LIGTNSYVVARIYRNDPALGRPGTGSQGSLRRSVIRVERLENIHYRAQRIIAQKRIMHRVPVRSS
jgi:hypothetical protein